MKNIVILFTIIAFFLLGCQTSSPDKQTFSIYIESWEHISISVPEITGDGHMKTLSKDEATKVISDNMKDFKPSADVMLGKSGRVKIDNVQDWLVSIGITDIVFKAALSSRMPPVVREYHNGKITKP